MMNYLEPRLFSPLGIENVECEYNPEGYFYGATGMKLTINELSRFGQLYLQEGCYEGKRFRRNATMYLEHNLPKTLN